MVIKTLISILTQIYVNVVLKMYKFTIFFDPVIILKMIINNEVCISIDG